MRIAPVSFGKKQPVEVKGIKIDYSKPDGGIPKDVPDSAVVAHSRLDNTYIYPITAGAVREKAREAAQICSKKDYTPVSSVAQETPEEYLARKTYSTEWCM